MSRLAVLALAACSLLALPTQAQAAPQPFGSHTCRAENGVRVCTGPRVASHDGVPIDVDVTLPATGDGPFPTIMMLHGYGGNKSAFQTIDAQGRKEAGKTPDSATLYHYNNVHFAQRGYAVVTHTARGFGDSCGRPASRTTPACARGFIRLADQRYEVRDAQVLLGRLVDDGITERDGIGVTGISYGGGQSAQLAILRDRIRRIDGSFAPWRSPKGTPVAITAAWPKWLWSDLVYSLLPNGRFLDFAPPAPVTQDREPFGVPIQSYLSGLYALGAAQGYYAPPGTAPDADITRWYARVTAGEPYGPDARAIADEIAAHHQANGLPGTPTPLLLQDGWTDDLFPVHESLRLYNNLRAVDRDFPVSLQFGDIGHARAANKENTDRFFNDQGTGFLDRYIRGRGTAPAPGSVTTFTQTCPVDAPAAGPFQAADWPGIHPGAVRFSSSPPQTVRGDGGDPARSAQIDPIAGGGDNCRKVASDRAPGTAVYELPASSGWTLMGRPTVRARIETTGPFGQLDARLWDVAPDGQQVLVTRSAYRLLDNQQGDITFQLNGNGYRFAAGHVPKLELLGRDAPYLRPSNGDFLVVVRDLSLELPTLERPDGGQIGGPVDAAPVASASPRPRSRPAPALRVRITPPSDRRGRRRFTTSGRLVLPPGVTAEDGCRGRIAVQFKSGSRTLSARRVQVRPSCTFRSGVTFTLPRRFRGRPLLSAVVRFQGNAALRPVRSAPRTVRVG